MTNMIPAVGRSVSRPCVSSSLTRKLCRTKHHGASASHLYQDSQHWRSAEQLASDIQILHHDEHILAVNKPNGVPMHGIPASKVTSQNLKVPQTDDISMATCVDILKQRLKVDNLTPMYSQNRLYSGVVVYTKTDAAKESLQQYFRHVRANAKFCQTYLALATGIPKEASGYEKFNISRKTIDEDTTLSVKCESSRKQKHRRMKREVIKTLIKHQILSQFKSSQSHVALVQLQPIVTKWEAIELYMLSNLSLILGDHRYSSRLVRVMGKPFIVDDNKAVPAPQVLPVEFLQRLQLKDASIIPLHLHCSQLILPDLSTTSTTHHGDNNASKPRRVTSDKQTMLTIDAPLPEFFKTSLVNLGLESEIGECDSDKVYVEQNDLYVQTGT